MPESRLWWLTGNPWTKLLSLLLALVTWLYVQGDEVHEGTVKAAVVWSLPPGLASAEPLPGTVNLSVRGTRAAIRKARESLVRVPVDLSDIGAGEHGLEFATFQSVGLPPSIEVLGVQPSAMRFTLDEQITRKVKIKPVLVGDPGAGFQVEGTTFDPPVVDVRGPRSVVDPLVEIPSQPIDVSGLVADATAEVELDLPRMVQLDDEVVPTAIVEVVPTVERRIVAGVQVHVWGHYGFVPEVTEAEVTFEGPQDEVRRLGSENVVAFVHVPEPADRGRYEAWFGPQEGVRVRVLHPRGDEVKVIGVQPPTIAVVRQ